MKLSRVFSKSFPRTASESNSNQSMPGKNLDRAQMPKLRSTSSKGLYSGITQDGMEAIDWELRPGGMLVQRRDSSADLSPSSGPLIKVKVSHGRYQHEIGIPAQATFGDMKWLLAQEIGLQPHEQRLLFRGKEREDSDFLHIAGVKDMEKVILVEDPASKEKKLEEMRRNDDVGKACHAVSQVRAELDKLSGQLATLGGLVVSGSKVMDHDFSVLSELLVSQSLKLDSIDAEGEAQVQRRIEVRRVQNFVEQVDTLKIRNSNPIYSNTAVVSSPWETFDDGFGSLMTAPPLVQATMTTNWEVFD